MSPSKSLPSDRRDARKVSAPGKRPRQARARAVDSRSDRPADPPVLPGENAEAYRGRLEAWSGSLGPRNAVELYLVEHAVSLSWQLDRADRVRWTQLARDTDPAGPDRESGDAGAPADRPASVDGESGERLSHYQLACGQALLRTLDAFARLRGIRQDAAVPPDVAPTLHVLVPASGMADEPAGNGEPGTILQGPVAEARTERPARGGSDVTPPIPVASTGTAPPAAGRGAEGSPDEAEDRPPAPAPTSGRRRIAGRLDRQADWSGGGRAQVVESRSRPVRRSLDQPDATNHPPDARRRVGGYAVPMDPSVPVSCADRIPVRLRREASLLRQARAAACPS